MGPVDEGGGHGLYGEPIQQIAETDSNREGVVCLSILRAGLASWDCEGLGSWLLQGFFKWAMSNNVQAAVDSRTACIWSMGRCTAGLLAVVQPGWVVTWRLTAVPCSKLCFSTCIHCMGCRAQPAQASTCRHGVVLR